MNVLITGASGYVGGRLVQALSGYPLNLRCAYRRRKPLELVQQDGVEVVQADIDNTSDLHKVLQNIDVAYYLIHGLGDGTDSFVKKDRERAESFATAAKAAGVRRIIYLGGLAEEPSPSKHLASRHEVGRILRESSIPTLEFRASIIIGPGSTSFLMIKALVERLPIMVTPSWVHTLSQPIFIDDIIRYLKEALLRPDLEAGIYEIGGAEQLSYLDLMMEYAAQRKLRRLIVPVPVLSPYLSSLWLSIVTPLYAQIGRQLIEGVRCRTVVNDPKARLCFGFEPTPIREAIARSIQAINNRTASPTPVTGSAFNER